MKKLLCLCLVAACGGGGDAIGIDQFGSEVASVTCAKQFECCTDAEIMEMYMDITIDNMPVETEEQCVELTDALIRGFLVEGLKDSIAKGRVEYSADAAGACLAVVRDLSCADYGTVSGIELDGCEPYITPLVDEGGACLQSYECTTGSCQGASNPFEGEPVDGVCARPPGAGEACDGDCVDGYFCGFDTTSGDAICIALKGEGEDCTFDSDCTSDFCDDQNMCAAEDAMCTGR